MDKTLFQFLEQNDSNELFENHLNATVTSRVYGGRKSHNSKEFIQIDHQCDPWSSCDAWNCNPDCTCKNLS